jgi:Ni,Fe-hydrogenase III small subunit
MILEPRARRIILHLSTGLTMSKNAIFQHALNAYYLPLADCGGGCLENLIQAVERLPVEWVNKPKHADIIFISGVITNAIWPQLKDVFSGLSKPFFLVRIGQCMGNMNKKFEDAQQNYAIPETVKKFFPINLFIDGCPPTVDEMVDKLETFLNYLDLTPEITKTLDEKLDKAIFNP